MEINDKVKVTGEGVPFLGKEGIVTGIYEDGTVDVRISLTIDETVKHVVQNYLSTELEVIATDEGMNMEELKQNLNEAKEEIDIIEDYVFFEDIDGKKIPTWFFIDKIATAEGMGVDKVFDEATKHKYNLFMIEAEPNFSKVVVAAKGLNEDDIFADYADYLQGNARVTKMN